ncbi:DUF2975 domain-containing protein [Pseudactinotalea sp. Z1732]|uniref:DUF2975 domain-containing protein n=1 Tax=Pseudactinotalea sp. Z1732 TaxID=3413026 RepID=UPI003C7D23B9
MSNRFVVVALQAMLVAALVVIAAVQLVGLPWLSGVVARDLPDEAHMRWPILTLAILGLICVQVGIICTLRLLGFVRSGEVFSTRAFGWVDGIIGAFLGSSLVCMATIAYQSATVAGPPLWGLMLIGGALTGLGLALLMTVMRTLLVRATTLRSEMDVVI